MAANIFISYGLTTLVRLWPYDAVIFRYALFRPLAWVAAKKKLYIYLYFKALRL